MTEIRRVNVDGNIRTVEVRDGKFGWFDGRTMSVDDVQHMAPITPTKMICVHLNYRSRLDELGRQQPPAPTYFWKPISATLLQGSRLV